MKYEISTLIVGRSIESLLYAWRTQTKIVVKDPEYVFRHDKRFEKYDFSFMNANNPKELYNNLVFALSLTSLLLCPGNIATIREQDDCVNIVTRGNRKLSVHPKEIIHFDSESSMFNVYDFFNTREMTPTELSTLEDAETDFIYQINFYKSPRVFSSRTRDVVGASRMTQEQLLSPDLGQGIAMLKMLRMFKAAGVKGKFAWSRKDKRYYKRPKIEFHRRVISRQLIPKHSFEDVYKMNQIEGDPWKMLEKLRKRQETSSE